MKNYEHIIVLVGLLIIFSCEFNEGPEHPYEDTQNLCIINSDGTSYSIIAESYYAAIEKYFVNNDSQILVAGSREFNMLNTDGSNIIPIPVQMNFRTSCISHDRSKIAFVGQNNSEEDVFIMDWNGLNLKKITNTPFVIKRYPSFSYDGNKIVYSTIYDYQTPIIPSVEIVDIISGEITVVIEDTDHGSKSSTPYWYPCFGENDDLIFYIYEYWSYEQNVYANSLNSISVDGTISKVVENDIIRLGNITSLFNSEKIVFLGSADPHHVFISDYNGLNKIDLGTAPSPTLIRASDDGTMILYGNENAYYDDNIVIINTDGTDRKILSKGGSPVFSADASKILFTKKEIITH